jgi:hypothetical protein
MAAGERGDKVAEHRDRRCSAAGTGRAPTGAMPVIQHSAVPSTTATMPPGYAP